MRGMFLRVALFLVTLAVFGVRPRSLIAADDARSACIANCADSCEGGCSSTECEDDCVEHCPSSSPPSSYGSSYEPTPSPTPPTYTSDAGVASSTDASEDEHADAGE